MSAPRKNDVAPYGDTRPGFESVYTAERSLPQASPVDSCLKYGRDAEGNVTMTCSSWGFTHLTEAT